MTNRLYAKYLWLIQTINKNDRISFEDIARKWDHASINLDHEPLQLRTFHNHRKAIEREFQIYIECDKRNNLYYIENPEDLKGNSINRWLLDSFSVSSTLMSNRNLADRILLEEIPSGRHHLDVITSAMQENRQMLIDYEDFFGNRNEGLLIEPYCLKVFKRRWYIFAYVPSMGIVRRFGLDRIEKIELTEKTFDYPKDFSPEAFFHNLYGVIHDEKPTRIRLKAYREKPNYLRSLPLHHSQHEIETGEDYAIFEYWIAPTFDFVQEILLHRDQLEVLSPAPFREHVASVIRRMCNFYK